MQDYCQVVRDEFKLLDRRDQEELSRFFLRYKFFTTNDLAQILSMSSRHIRRLKTIAKVTNSRGTSPPQKVRIPPDIQLEPNWDREEWWRRYYPKYGCRVLARATGMSMRTVMKHLRKFGITIRTDVSPSLSSHPCCNYEWLQKHYNELDLGLVRCAEIAGVCPDTISGWLNAYKIQVKSRYGPSVGRTWKGTFVGKATSLPAGTN
jgi:hypothetical protein